MQDPNVIIHTKDCPYCHSSPLEIYGMITKNYEGIFDEEGNLETQTTREAIVGLVCINCGKDLPLDLIKNWN